MNKKDLWLVIVGGILLIILMCIPEQMDNKVHDEEIEVEYAEPEAEEIVEEPKIVSLGEFRLTAYCPCRRCCGRWVDTPTASGTTPTENRTIAVDTDIIPFGTQVIINGMTYTAEDTGSAIKGNRIDIYMDSHYEALQFGVQYAEIFIVEE